HCLVSDSLEPLPLEEHPAIKSLSAFRDYYWEIFALAVTETFRFFGWHKRTLLVPFLYLVGAIVGFAILEGEVVREEILTALAFGLIPVAGLAVLVTLVNIIRAPYLFDSKRLSAQVTSEQGFQETL